MEEKKYQIFISSTYTDLEKERDKIIETILGIYHLPVGMEMFSAGNEEQWEIIKDTIASSDYYILIVGHRYGSVTKDGISYTEKEYDYAAHLKKPILAFIRDRDIPTEPKQRESDPDKTKKLDEFIQKVTSNKMCDFWSTKDDLAAKVAIALPKTFRRNPQIGWIRGDQAISPKLSEELVELSSRNRQLTDELNELKKKVSIRAPDLEIFINNHNDSYEYTIDKNNEAYITVPTGLNYNDIPDDLKDYISREEVNKYNLKLPSKDRLAAYQKELYYYNSLKNKAEHSKLEIKVSNTGTTKANNIFVTLAFPKEILVYDIDEDNNPNEPYLNLPENPIKIAQQRKREAMPNNTKIFNTLSAIAAYPNINLAKISRLTTPNINYWSSLDDNTITFKLSELLHTRSRTFKDQYLIYPLKSGEFKINVSIISEELENPIEYNLPAIIE